MNEPNKNLLYLYVEQDDSEYSKMGKINMFDNKNKFYPY